MLSTLYFGGFPVAEFPEDHAGDALDELGDGEGEPTAVGTEAEARD